MSAFTEPLPLKGIVKDFGKSFFFFVKRDEEVDINHVLLESEHVLAYLSLE